MAGSTTNSPNPFQHPSSDATAFSTEIEFDQQLAFNSNTHFMQQPSIDSNHLLSFDHSNWDSNGVQMENPPYNPTPDLLNLLRLPKHSISFSNTMIDNASVAASVLYDPLMFQSLPHGYGLPNTTRNGSLFGEDGENGNCRQFENGVLEFSRDIACTPKGKDNGNGKHFTTERERRQNLNGKYNDLKELVPNPTKPDRASIVGDAIDYIKELKRTVTELKLLVEKKRCGRERNKRLKIDDDGAGGEVESIDMKRITNPDQSYNGSALRTSWLQRKSKDAEVDVRIIDDEVTIKLVQRKKINSLLLVSKVLDELRLDLHHVAGGSIGDHYSYLFNTRMFEGSSVYASAIAMKLIEVVDRHTVCSTYS